MHHSGHHKQPIKIADFLRRSTALVLARFISQSGDYTLVIIDAGARRDRGVRPAMIMDDLATVPFERAQVGVGRIEN